MYRVFLSHSRRDNSAAQAVFQWLTEAEPSLKGEIFLDVNPRIGFAPGVRWKSELARAVDRCEAVICLISPDWEKSGECVAEARLAESLNKRVFCARIDPAAQGERIREWQICDLFADGHGEQITVTSDDGEPVVFSADGLARLLRGLRDAGIGAEYFPWPPEKDSKRVPYRGWQSMEDADAAVFFGRDPQILRGLDALRGMRATGVESLFVILGPSGVGKSSFLRAGLLPRLRRDHRNFLVADIVRPERAAVTGDHGLAQAIWQLRSQAGPGRRRSGTSKPPACTPTPPGSRRGCASRSHAVSRAVSACRQAALTSPSAGPPGPAWDRSCQIAWARPLSPVTAARSGRTMSATRKFLWSRRNRGSRPARRNDDLPTPDGPRITNRLSTPVARMPRSASKPRRICGSRPKNTAASASSIDCHPRYGARL